MGVVVVVIVVVNGGGGGGGGGGVLVVVAWWRWNARTELCEHEAVEHDNWAMTRQRRVPTSFMVTSKMDRYGVKSRRSTRRYLRRLIW